MDTTAPRKPLHELVNAADVVAEFDRLVAAGAKLDRELVGTTPAPQAALEAVLTIRKRLIASLEQAARVAPLSEAKAAELALLRGRRPR